MSVERWAVHFTHNPKTGRNDYEGMVRHPVGAYVAYADYKALTAELEAARRDAEERLPAKARELIGFNAYLCSYIGLAKTAELRREYDAARQQEATNANG